MAARRSATRNLIVAAAIAVMAGLPPACGGITRAQTVDDVAATVRVSPVQARLNIAPTRVRIGQFVVAIGQFSNLSDSAVAVLEPRMGFQAGAFSIVLHAGSRQAIIRPHSRRTDVWLLRARRSGTFVLMASTTALTSEGVRLVVDSNAEVLSVRPR